MATENESLKATVPAFREQKADDSLARDLGVFLVVLEGANVGRVFLLGMDGNLLGRDDFADVQIVDGGISRRHAMVAWNPEKGVFEASDLGSRNGTTVNGQKLTEPRTLVRGDKIEIGIHTVLRVSFSDEPETKYAHQMYKAVLRDGLTGVFNRRYFDERMSSELAFAQRHAKRLSLLMADIDHFKQVNDTYDHPGGDAVLKQFARLVGKLIRSEDVFARYGGEEFVVICRETEEDQAAILAERIRQTVANHGFQYNGTPIKVSVSIGVACLGDHGADTAEKLITAADKALYKAKEQGRNRIVRYSAQFAR